VTPNIIRILKDDRQAAKELRPVVKKIEAARNANFTGGGSPNRAASDLLDAHVRNDPSIYLPLK
jgi:hypothetical protein